MAIRTYTEDFKAQVITEFALGSSQTSLAIKHKIPRSTVRAWTSGLGVPSVATETKESIDAKILTFADEAVTTLIAILRHSRDPAWLQKQTANDLAIFFGVTTDKVTAVFAAFERGADLRDAEREAAARQLTSSPRDGGE